MSEQETEQTEEEPTATDDQGAPEASASDEETAPESSSSDEEMAAVVDQRASELTGEDSGATLADSGPGDPIAQAEAHIDSLDMDAERKKVEQLTKQL